MNTVCLLGRCTAKPELKRINDTVDLVKFSIACNEYRKSGDDTIKDTHFFDCEAWDSGARVIAEQVNKGDLLAISGKLRQSTWQSTDGTGRSKVIIRVGNFTIAKRAFSEATEPAKKAEPTPELETVNDESAPF